MVFKWGKITYYPSKRVFEAICRHPAHGKCVLTRTSHGRGGAASGAGRPMGFLAAWLERADQPSKAAHWAPEVLHASAAARRAAREAVKAMPNGPALLSHERPKENAEDSEPEGLAGFV